MENYYSVNTLIVIKAIKFIVPFNGQTMVKNTELYGLKIGSLMYLVT